MKIKHDLFERCYLNKKVSFNAAWMKDKCISTMCSTACRTVSGEKQDKNNNNEVTLHCSRLSGCRDKLPRL